MKYNVGDKVGKLTILEILPLEKDSKRKVKCKCDCGNEKIFKLNNIGHKTNSCGCLKAELIKKNMGKDIKDLAVTSALFNIKRKTVNSDLKAEDIKKIIFSTCFYCEKTSDEVGTLFKRPKDDGRRVLKLGIDRIDNNKGYFKNNIVACCQKCNMIKMHHSIDDLHIHLETMAKNMRKLL